jgi:hypothetical protein
MKKNIMILARYVTVYIFLHDFIYESHVLLTFFIDNITKHVYLGLYIYIYIYIYRQDLYSI